MATSDILEIASRYKATLERTIHPLSLILFGSHARGSPNPDSDIDIAVVVTRIEGDYLDLQASLWKAGREVDDRIEPVLFIDGSDPSGFYESIKAYGQPID
ncbi:MAG: nucleotidyltransferase domain-containing protein [Spirochaetota bacterium]